MSESPEEFASNIGMGKNQHEGHHRDGRTMLRKIFKKSVYSSLGNIRKTKNETEDKVQRRKNRNCKVAAFISLTAYV